MLVRIKPELKNITIIMRLLLFSIIFSISTLAYAQGTPPFSYNFNFDSCSVYNSSINETPPIGFKYNRTDSAICDNQIQKIRFINDYDTTEYFIEYRYSYSNNNITKITTGFLKLQIPFGEFKTIDDKNNITYCLDFDTLPIGYQEIKKIAKEHNIDLNNRNVYYNHKSEFNSFNEGSWVIPLETRSYTDYHEYDELLIDAFTGIVKETTCYIHVQPIQNEFIDPRFVGGRTELMKFLKENSKFIITDNGRNWVQVNFDITRRGTVKNALVDCTNSTSHNQEAIRLVESFPRWIPARNRAGKKIDINWRIGINFE